jgi:hypothetical protein
MLGDDTTSYGDREPNDSSPWIELRDFAKVAPTDDSWTPITVLGRRFKSSSPDSEAFLHDPLTVLMNDALDPDKGEVEALGQITRDWHVSTIVVNHQATLLIRHLNAIVTLNPDDPSVGIMLVKQTR